MKNVQLKLLVAFLIVFSCTLLFHIRESQAIYKEVKSSTISLSVVDSTSSHTVTLDARNGSTTTVSVIHNGTIGSALYTPTRTNYNFMGWYDSNNQRIYADKQITGNVTFHAEWTKIVCKKVTDVNNLNTEECLGSAGCVTSGVGYTAHSTITYGTIFGENSPKAGDAYDCDVYYNPNEDTFDEVDTYGKHIERFYFVRDKENNGSEDTAVLIYYTSFDGNGRVDTQNTDKNNIGSGHYDVAMTWLPTSSTWANPGLINFGSGTGTISRFLSVADLTTVCGPLNNNGTANTNYFINCLGGTKQNWFLFENSRFQASSLGRAGIWLETDGIRFYRIQTGSIAVGTFTLGTNSDNMARPVIEIPMSALEGFVNANRYTITFETHGGTPTISSVRRYEGETIGEIPTVTLEHNTFDGWYQTYTNGEYSNPAGTSTVVHSDLTLHAKWVAKSTCTVNLVLNGGTGLDTPVVVDVGDLYVPGTPTKDDNTFVGWFTDSEMTVSYDSTVPISGSSLTLYAKWASVNYVADVAGVGQFESLTEAFANVPTTGVKTKVTLLQNITISSNTDCTTVNNNQYIDFDLNGKTVTSTNAVTDNLILVDKGGTLEISNGTINNAGSKSVIYVKGTGSNKGTLYIKPGSAPNITHFHTTGDYSVISNLGDAYMSGGVITSISQPAAVNTGTDGNLYNAASNFVMTGGTITTSGSQKNQAIYNNGGARLEISGDTYLYSQSSDSSKLRATVHNNSGVLVITGGTIVSKNFAAVVSATASTTSVTIGSDDGTINITTPVLRGKTYGLESGAAYIYDGIFESATHTRAISATSITKPVDFYDTTVSVDGNTYYATYLLVLNFTVNFYPANGEEKITKIIDNGDAIGTNMPNDPVKANYYFDGWYDNDTLITSETVPNSDIDAYARWVQSINSATISSTLNVEKNSCETITISGNDIESRSFVSGNTNVATVDSNGVVTGINIGTTTITITGSKSGDTKTITVTVTPIVHDVKFYQHEGGTLITTISVGDGETVNIMPNNPTEDNYVFDGWVFTAGNSLTPFTSGVEVYGDIDVIATWKEKVTYATLATSPSPLEIVKGDTGQITLTATDQNGIVEGYSYVSSDTNVLTVNSGGTVTGINVGTATITITGSMSGATKTVTAIVYVVTHNITFYTDSDKQVVWDTVVVEDGYSIANMPNTSMPNNPSKTNYIFDGWAIEDGNSLTTFTSEVEVYDDIDVIALWVPSIQLATIPTTFNVVFGSSRTISVTGPSGMESYTFSSADPTIATVDSVTGLVHGEAYGTVNVSVIGQRSNATKTVSVIVGTATHEVNFLDDDGETQLYPSVSVDDGGVVGGDMPVNPTKSGYVFDGWICNDGNSLTEFTSATEIYGDIDVIAVWKEPISSAAIASSITIRLGSSEQITLLPSGSRAVENYTIISSDSNTVEVNNHTVYGTAVGSVTLTIIGTLSGETRTITANVTNSYEVTFKDDDDTVLETIYVENGNSIDNTEGANLPNDLTKSGYTFDDWYIYDGSSVTTTRLDTGSSVTSDLVYKPRWAAANDVAAIGTTYYSSLSLAIENVESGVPTEIRIINNISNLTCSVGNGITTNSCNKTGRTTIPSGKDVTIAGGKFTVSCGNNTVGNLIYNNGGILRIKNGTFTCNKSGLATFENTSAGHIYIYGGTITNTNNRGVIYNPGSVHISGGELSTSSAVKIRSVVQNTSSGALIEMTGGTIIQYAASMTEANGYGAIKVVAGSTAVVTGGEIISHSVNSGAIYNAGTLVIGTTANNTYDVTSPVIKGEQFGIDSSTNYSIYDGIIKGKGTPSAQTPVLQAVNNYSKITGTESGYNIVTGTEEEYYTLYYESASSKYRINFNGRGGTVSDDYIEYNLNETITANDLATATKGIYTFAGWYTDENRTQPFTSFIPTQADTVTYYAEWSYDSSTTPVSHIITSDAMTNYFTNISTWANADAQIANNQDQSLNNDDHNTFLNTMLTNFNNYSCSECEITTTRDNMNSCKTPSSGTYCDQPKGYDTGIGEGIDVYLYVNNAKFGSKLNGTELGNYITSDDGIIYNMIPGITYYWESQNDSNVYGVVYATKNSTNYRRTLKTSIRNLRDLGGMSVSYTASGVTVNGTIKYGKLYRGAQNSGGTAGINELKKLGITREVDLRANGDGNGGQTKYPAASYDVSISDSLYTRFYNKSTYTTDQYKDVKITNYFINPTANAYFSDPHGDDFQDLKQAMKAIMRQVVNHEVVFFHCTIGTDRTGTMAYFIEGLLGVSNEDRLRDYEMTYFFGLTNRSRFHNNLGTSSINPRFYAMYKSYPDVSDIEDFYFDNYPESDDESLLTAFRSEMIQQ